jgi:predicted PurR-regulated permease PerM
MKFMTQKHIIDTATRILFRAVLIGFLIWVLYMVIDVVLVLYIAIILSAALDPAISWLHNRFKWPRVLTVSIIYILFFVILGTVLSFIVPSLIEQTQRFAQDLPEQTSGLTQFLENIGEATNLYNFDTKEFGTGVSDISNQLSSYAQEIFSTTRSLFRGIIVFIAILALAFYMSVEPESLRNFLLSVTPKHRKKYVSGFYRRMHKRVGKWLLGMLSIMFFVFCVYALILTLLGVPYAIFLALLGGLLEIIPYIGPMIASIPAIILGFLVSPVTGVLVAVGYLGAQQVQNHIVTPNVMRKAVGISPVTTIVAMLAGAQLAGVLGIILAVPTATIVTGFVDDLIEGRVSEDKEE